MEPVQLRDSDLAAFMHYAARERSLDRDAAIYRVSPHGAEHLKSVDALRVLNYRMLLRDTRHG